MTEQLLLLEDMQEDKFLKDLKKLRKKLIKRLAKKVEQISDILTKRNETTDVELLTLADPWSASAELLYTGSIKVQVAVPRINRAGFVSTFYLGHDPIAFIPESFSLAGPVETEFGAGEDVFVMIDVDQIVDKVLERELFNNLGTLPEANEVLWIIEWLDDLVKSPTE